MEPLPPPRAARVLLHDEHFHPDEVRVRRGGRVVFRWEDGSVHDVDFADPRIRDVKARSKGAVTRRFNRRGTYEFVCTLHDGMDGKVVVR